MAQTLVVRAAVGVHSLTLARETILRPVTLSLVVIEPRLEAGNTAAGGTILFGGRDL